MREFNMREFIKKYKLYIIIIIATLILFIGTTLAWYVWTSTTNTLVNLDVCTPTITFVGDSTINGADTVPVLTKEEGITKEIKIEVDNNCTKKVTMTLKLELTTFPIALSDETFVYELYKDNVQVANGNFANKEEGSIITLYNTEEVSNKDTYILYIYIDGTKDNSSDMAGKDFIFNLYGEGSNAVYEANLASYITELYKNNLKSEVENNNIIYNYATSVSLMNDRLGSMTTDIDAGNIRYYGSEPNNYIYFNCTDYLNQNDTTCELWRIIGVFNDKVKIIRNSSIGDLAWDYDKNIDNSLTTYDNNWYTSSLQILLNEKYYYGDTTGAVTYYSNSQDKILSLNMASIGIKSDITRNLISEETYHLRGNGSSEIYANQIYNYERNGTIYSDNNPAWTGKIALAYPSDYGYAVDLNKCTQNLINYNDSSCTGNNWLKDILGTSNTGSDGGWLLTPFPEEPDYAWRVTTDGIVHSRNTIVYARKVVPTLYLDTNVKLDSNTGTGTSGNPYKLSA